MSKRVTLDRDYIMRIKKENTIIQKEVEGLNKVKIHCKYCTMQTIVKYEDLHGHFEAFCKRCGQIAVYNADFRRFSMFFWKNDIIV